MRVLVDCHILTRSAQPGHPMHIEALDAVRTLKQSGEELCAVPQNLYEFWVVATRPMDVNGLGMSTTQAQAELTRIKSFFRVLPDIPAIYPEWEKLVVQHAVSGKNAHDARIVAAMNVHGITHLLTFNAADFKRFHGLSVISPAAVK